MNCSGGRFVQATKSKTSALTSVFMSAAVVPLKLIEVVIWTEVVLHGLSHLLPSKVGVPKWPALHMLGMRRWKGGGHMSKRAWLLSYPGLSVDPKLTTTRALPFAQRVNTWPVCRRTQCRPR